MSDVEVGRVEQSSASGSGAVFGLALAAMVAAAAVWWPAHQSYQTYPFIGTPPKIRDLEKDLEKRSDDAAKGSFMASIKAFFAPHGNLSEAERHKLDLYSFSYRSRNVGYVVMLFGGAVGAATMLISGIAAGSFKRALLGLIGGAALGGGFGFAGGILGEYVFEQLHQVGSKPSAFKTATFHAAGFGLTAVGIGLASFFLGESFSQVVRRCAGAIVGAALASALFVPVCGIAFPLAKTTYFVPEEAGGRLLWFLLNALCIAVGLSVGASRRRSQAVPASAG